MMQYSESRIFILGDGDDIRHRVELYLLAGNFIELSRFSRSLTDAVTQIKTYVSEAMSAEVVFAGGDDILFLISERRFDRAKLEQAMAKFKLLTGNTISFGVGKSVEAAYLNLRKAKAEGKGVIVES